MNALLGAATAGSSALVFWAIAGEAARDRRVRIGSLPVVLPLAGAAAAGTAALGGAHAGALAACGAVAVAAWVDARTGLIFDPLTSALFATSLVAAGLDGALYDGLAGTLCLGALLYALHAVTGGRGIGLGDVKLGAALGMALGLAAGLTTFGCAFVFGGIYGVWLLAARRARPSTRVRFGPFIAAGTATALILPLGGFR
jgi:leader peptidase (prepilin peptidase)/N-methyltransferase